MTVNHSVWFHLAGRLRRLGAVFDGFPGSGGFARGRYGHFFNRSGEVVATFAQEGVVKHFGSAKR